jgi:NAD(P)-dependent dehydrogenase (short-subunit alcohol dehydrogenase family)
MKKIILIGGSGVLGKYFAEKLSLNNELHVADIGLKKKKITRNRYNYFLDILNEKKINEFFKKIKVEHGTFDILINNAAFTTEMASKFTKLNKKDYFSTKIWENTVNTNLRGPFLACKYFLKYHHNKNIDQRVINIGTIYGIYSPHHHIYTHQKFFSSISYTASKAGLIGMTKWLATKFAQEKTNFNMVSPAGVFNNHNKKFLKDYTNLIPKKIMASEKQIYSAIEFLISNDADYVIGQNIIVDGGFSAW